MTKRTEARIVQLDHSEIIRAVQIAMVAQLRQDGRLPEGAELGLVFIAHDRQNIQVVGRVKKGPWVLHVLRGDRRMLAPIAVQAALDKLRPEERRGLVPAAEVRWRTVRFTSDDEVVDRFMVDVTFTPKKEGAA